MNFIFDPGLVLYLPLYELDGSSFMSRDAHGHSCMVTGAKWRPNGHYFDGVDDYINCGTNSVINMGTSDFTALAWINSDSISSLQRIFNKEQDDTHRWYWGFVSSKPYYYNKTTVSAYSATTVNTLSGSTWYCLTLVNQRSIALKLYVNGNDDTSGSPKDGGENIDNTQDLTLGGKPPDGMRYVLSGVIGEVALYKRALTP